MTDPVLVTCDMYREGVMISSFTINVRLITDALIFGSVLYVRAPELDTGSSCAYRELSLRVLDPFEHPSLSQPRP